MKNKYLGLLIGLMSTGAWANCSYDFNATQAQITAYGNGMLKFPMINDQKTSFTISPMVNNSTTMYYATNTNALQNTYNILTPPASGIFAYEYKFKVPLNQMTNEEQISFFPIIAGSRASTGLIQGNYLGYLNSSSSAAERVLNEFSIANKNAVTLVEMPVTNTSDGYQRIGIYVNQSTKQIGFVLNGVNKGYMDSYSEPIQGYYFEHLAGIRGFSATSANLGKEISIELITDASQMSQNYPSGAKDICGNII